MNNKTIAVYCYWCTKKQVINGDSLRSLKTYVKNNNVRCKNCKSKINHQFEEILDK